MKRLVCALALVVCGCSASDPAPVVSDDDNPNTALPHFDGIANWKLGSAKMDEALWPASVPRDYVFTPQGFSHPDCLHQLLEGEYTTYDRDRRVTQIRRADGSVREEHGSCPYSRFSKLGVEIAARTPVAKSGGVHPNLAQGYQFAAHYWSAGQDVGRTYSDWRVPLAPSTDGATIYIWNGLGGTYDLYQPILYSHGGSWGFMETMWQDGNTFGGAYYAVEPGMIVRGETAIVGTAHREYAWYSTDGRVFHSIGYTDYGEMDATHDDSIFGAAEIWSSDCSQWPGWVIYGQWAWLDTESFTGAGVCFGKNCYASAPPSISIESCAENSCNTDCSVVSSTQANWSWHD